MANLCYRSRNDPDFRDRPAMYEYLERCQPEVMIVCPESGQSVADSGFSSGAPFFEKWGLGLDLIEAADYFDVARFIYIASPLASPLIRTKNRRGFISEEQRLDDALDEVEQDWASSTLACVKLCEGLKAQFGKRFVSMLPCSLYGPGDPYQTGDSQLIPGLVLKMILAKKNGDIAVTCLGSGDEASEWLYADDLASACLVGMESNEFPMMNVGSGELVSFKRAAESIASIVGFNGEIIWDPSSPVPISGSLLDRSKINSLGWSSETCFEDGIQKTVEDFIERIDWKNKLEQPIDATKKGTMVLQWAGRLQKRMP